MGITKDKKPSVSAAAKLRRRAEEQLRAKTAKLRPPQTEKVAQRLVHELEVHQIELEMQNAELKRSQEELELSRNKYVELYDFAPVGYFTFDATRTDLEVNLTGANLLGMRERLPKKPFINFIARAQIGERFFRNTAKRFFENRAARPVKSG